MQIPLQPTSQEIWEQKYQLKDDSQRPVDLNINDTLKRVAGALARNEKDPDYWRSKFLWALENGATPAGRIISNAGAEEYKPAVSLINCVVSQIVEDSMIGILETNTRAGLTLAAGCGIGYEFSTLRPRGAFVTGAGAYTSGSLSFMDIYDSMCFTIASAGGRRGAQMAGFAVWHPDVEAFIAAKRQDGRFRQFNCSLLIDDAFMEAVKEDKEWQLRFPVRHSEIEKGIVDINDCVEYDMPWEREYCEKMGYIIQPNGRMMFKIYKTIRAAELWATIMKSTYDYAEPGFLLVDRINEQNNNYFCEEIRATNPCQPAWAKVLTKEGIRTFADIDVGTEIWSKEGWTTVVKKWRTGVKPVYKYTTTSGAFYGTENHRIVSNGVKVEAKDAESIDIITGPTVQQTIDPLDVMDGLVIGDGTVHKASNDKVLLCIGENDTDYFNSEISTLIGNARPGIGQYVYEVTTTIKASEIPSTYDRCVPSRFLTNPARAVGFLRGLYSANGSVCGNRITLKASSRQIIEDVQMLLNSIGIRSYFTTNKPTTIKFSNGDYLCKESYDLNITTDRKKFADTIGFIQQYKNDKISHTMSTKFKKTYDIIDVSLVSEEEVFDITVDNESHTYWTQGCNVSNCGEQPLPPNGSCLLGSVNLAKMVNDPFTDKASFDWEKYKEVVRIFSRMLDNVVEFNGLPLGEQRNEIETKRRHGMGFLGLGSAMSLMGIEYGSDESVAFTEEAMKVMAVEGFREGIALAKEKGAAPILQDEKNRELWCNGNFMQKIWGEDPGLRDEALKYGCRYTHATSIAPTGTISLSINNNTSNGIEPSFSHKYTRNVIREGKKTKEAVNVYSYEMLLYKHITGEEQVPETFSTAETVSPEAHIDIQAAAQKWCDSSISKTINVPTDYPFERFKEIYMYGYEKGLKGCTTFRYNPEAFGGVLVTEDNLKSTKYRFVTDQGEEVVLAGNDKVMYDGEEHSASNLFDALKEGLYGRF